MKDKKKRKDQLVFKLQVLYQCIETDGTQSMQNHKDKTGKAL